MASKAGPVIALAALGVGAAFLLGSKKAKAAQGGPGGGSGDIDGDGLTGIDEDPSGGPTPLDIKLEQDFQFVNSQYNGAIQAGTPQAWGSAAKKIRARSYCCQASKDAADLAATSLEALVMQYNQENQPPGEGGYGGGPGGGGGSPYGEWTEDPGWNE